jgi:hypothetical protein
VSGDCVLSVPEPVAAAQAAAQVSSAVTERLRAKGSEQTNSRKRTTRRHCHPIRHGRARRLPHGNSARAIGRKLSRDHHTVTRSLTANAGEELAFSLALMGAGPAAREVVGYMGGSEELLASVQEALFGYWAERGRHRLRLAQLALESLI